MYSYYAVEYFSYFKILKMKFLKLIAFLHEFALM